MDELGIDEQGIDEPEPEPEVDDTEPDTWMIWRNGHYAHIEVED